MKKRLTMTAALTETLEVMTDKHLMADLRRSLREARAGRLIPWERAKRQLELCDLSHRPYLDRANRSTRSKDNS